MFFVRWWSMGVPHLHSNVLPTRRGVVFVCMIGRYSVVYTSYLSTASLVGRDEGSDEKSAFDSCNRDRSPGQRFSKARQ